MADFPFPATGALSGRRLQNAPTRRARYWKGASLALIVLGLIGPLSAHGSDQNEEMAIISIVLNAENKGEFVVRMSGASDFYVRIDELKAMGFIDPRGTPRVFEGQTHLLLSSMMGVVSVYHEDNLSLDMTADPKLLKGNSADFTNARQPGVLYPQDNSLFFNYGFAYNAASALRFESFSSAQQLGVRVGEYLLLSDSLLTTGNKETSVTRLMTSVTHDNRSTLTRGILGDFFASSGMMGSMVQMGGLSYSKNYAINPYFVRQTTFNYTGYATLPSEVDVFIDGMRIRSEKFSPGGFDLRNILASSGAHDLEIRLKDSFGREEIVKTPYYFSEALLQKGLHEYSYNAGFLREAFGEESNRYGEPAFIASHRYGLTDWATVGMRGEGSSSLINLGPQMTFSLQKYGTLDGMLAISAGESLKPGWALSIGHNYMGQHLNTRLLLSSYSEDYGTIASQNILGSTWERTKSLLMAGIGYGNETLGSLSLDFYSLNSYPHDDQRSFAVSYSRSLTKTLSLYASYRRILESEPDHQVSLGITYYPGQETTATANYQRNQKTQVGVLQLQKNPPTGEGLSYRASVEQRENRGIRENAINPYVQYNGRYGIYSAEYRGSYEKDNPVNESYQLSAAGSVVYVGESIEFSRPVNDSFAVIQVGEVPGVRTYYNNKEVGTTDAKGRVVIPTLGSYVDNYLAINDQDIPVNFTLSGVQRTVSPPLHSGTLLRFEATKTQAISGILSVKSGTEVKPLENHEILLKVGDKETPYLTARDGEFYLENIPPGLYEASVLYQGKRLTFTLTIPETDDMIIELGVLTVEDRP